MHIVLDTDIVSILPSLDCQLVLLYRCYTNFSVTMIDWRDKDYLILYVDAVHFDN